MKGKRNEHIYKDELVVLDYLIHEYKKELTRTTKPYWKDKIIKGTRKTRLHRLRIEIDELLKSIEKNYPTEYCVEVE